MTATAKKVTTKPSKVNLEQEVTSKLEKALESFKDTLGEKKFRNRIKKASKNFLKGALKQSKIKAAVTAIKAEVAPKKKAVKSAKPAKSTQPAKSIKKDK